MQDTKKIFSVFYTLIISILSLAIFLTGKNITAFDWPAIDMGIFFERYYDSNFLTNDFLTNSISASNPREIFGYFIIFLANFFDKSWYNSFFFLKVFFILTLPSLFFYAINSFFISVVKNDLQDFFVKTTIAIFIFYLLSNIEKYGVSWWPPLYYFVAAQTVSLFFALLGIICFNLTTRKKFWFFTSFFFFISALFHPTIALFLFIFNAIFCLAINFSKSNFFKIGLLSLIVILIPFLILNTIYKPEATLPAAEFVKYYVFQAHPNHYLPSQFGSLDGNSWIISYSRVALPLLILLLIGIYSKNIKIIRATALCLASYIGCLIVQYICVEKYQLKIFAIIGLSRFLFLGYWMMVGCFALTICEHYKKIFAVTKSFINPLFLLLNKIPYISFGHILPIIFIINFAVYKIYLDNPYQRLDLQSDGLFSFLKENSDANAVIASDYYQVEILLLAKRSIFTGGGFSFREDHFHENYRRTILWQATKYMNFEQIEKMLSENKIDYIIYKNSDKHLFLQQKPFYKNKYYSIYSMKKSS